MTKTTNTTLAEKEKILAQLESEVAELQKKQSDLASQKKELKRAIYEQNQAALLEKREAEIAEYKTDFIKEFADEAPPEFYTQLKASGLNPKQAAKFVASLQLRAHGDIDRLFENIHRRFFNDFWLF